MNISDKNGSGGTTEATLLSRQLTGWNFHCALQNRDHWKQSPLHHRSESKKDLYYYHVDSRETIYFSLDAGSLKSERQPRSSQATSALRVILEKRKKSITLDMIHINGNLLTRYKTYIRTKTKKASLTLIPPHTHTHTRAYYLSPKPQEIIKCKP